MTMYNECDLLKKAIEAFQNETGMLMGVIQKNITIDDIKIDAIIEMPHQGPKLAVEIKRWAQQANLGALAEQVKRLPMDGVLAADYINPNMGKKLKGLNIQFIDTVGNAYINQPPVYINVTGNKLNQQQTPPKDGTNRAFDTTGLKVVFGLLCNPLLIKTTYREIAKFTGVALGTVGWVINGLKDAGFILERGKERHLTNKRKLLDRWVEAYPEKLKPKQHVGEFVANDPTWWKDINIELYGAYWGGEVAAAKYTKYLQPQTITVYVPKEVGNKLFAKARLQKALDFDTNKPNLVRIFRPFWPKELDQTGDIAGLVNPILVYADLIATGDTRNLETARMIYEQYIDKHIGEDLF